MIISLVTRSLRAQIDFEKKTCKKQLNVWCLLSGSTKLIRCVPDQGVLVRCSTRGKLCCRRWRLTRKPTVTSPPCSLAKSPAHSSSAPSTERSSPGRSLPTESPSSLSSTRLKKSYLRSILVFRVVGIYSYVFG